MMDDTNPPPACAASSGRRGRSSRAGLPARDRSAGKAGKATCRASGRCGRLPPACPAARVKREFVGRVPASPRKTGISGGAARQPSVYVGFRPACLPAQYSRALPACLPANAQLTRASEAAGLECPKCADGGRALAGMRAPASGFRFGHRARLRRISSARVIKVRPARPGLNAALRVWPQTAAPSRGLWKMKRRTDRACNTAAPPLSSRA